MHPVRVAFWLLVGCLTLLLGQSAAAGFLLARFDERFDALAPWTLAEAAQLDAVRQRLAGAFVLVLGLALLLAGAAMAVPRRSPYTRPVVGWALLLVIVTLLLSIVFSPDSALLADNEPQLARMQQLLPLWYSVLQSVVVAAVIVTLIVAVVRLGKERAVDYYQRHDPTATWRGFTSWLDVASGNDLG
jgi:uncharacterized membrane protein YhaH (DUF805 family)